MDATPRINTRVAFKLEAKAYQLTEDLSYNVEAWPISGDELARLKAGIK